MTDRVRQLLEHARADVLREVRPPGVAGIRRTVHRRRGIAATASVAVAVAAISVGSALTGAHPSDPAPPATEPSGGVPTLPQPGPVTEKRAAAVYAALGDRSVTPWVMATAGVVAPDYENHVNDIPAGSYELAVYCAGEGTVDVVVKAGDVGDEKLAAGQVTCSEEPVAGRLSVRQPVDGYLRVFLSGDPQSAGGAAFSFGFVRKDPGAVAAPDSTANAAAAAAALGDSATAVTTERDKTAEKTLPAGDYLVSFACKGTGKLSFTVRSAGVLRDGTVTTDGRTELAVDRKCTAAANVTADVPVTLKPGSAITITATADDAARNRAGWAYTIRPA